jgi:hypothetical protein
MENVFPWVKIREYKQVSGKCWTYHWINDVRKKSDDAVVTQAAKRLHQLHRGGLYIEGNIILITYLFITYDYNLVIKKSTREPKQ